ADSDQPKGVSGGNRTPHVESVVVAASSAIEWTNATWNPVTGCDKVSPGCAHCYAETFAERFRGVAGHPYEQGFDLRFWPERLEQPLRWRRPRQIFVNSMSDLFHEEIPLDFLRAVFDVMTRASWHVFQILTKRHQRLDGRTWDEMPTPAARALSPRRSVGAWEAASFRKASPAPTLPGLEFALGQSSGP